MAAAGGGAGRAAGAGAGAALGAGAGAGAAALGAGAGAGAGAAALGAAMAPSQPAAAVAGVQVASRQQSSLVPFFQACSPVPLRQLSTDCAPAAVAKAAVANTIATLLNFFMVLLMGINTADILRKKRRFE